MATALVNKPNGQAQSAPRTDANTGLHGHAHDAQLVRVALAEAIGTFVLVLAIAAAVVAATLADPIAGAAYSSLAVPVAGGIALAVLAASLGPISGAHLNPAVTVGLALNRKFPWSRVPVYVLAQLVGAVGAALMVWWVYGPNARSVAHLGATVPAPGVDAWQAFGVEAVVTFVLVLVVVAVATGARAQASIAPLAIGAALAAAIEISGPISGAGVNPARALGPMIVAGVFTDWWVYLIAPLVGGALAAMLYIRFLRPDDTTS
jgi:MIP family channel proteins